MIEERYYLKLLADACWPAVAAFVFGLCCGRLLLLAQDGLSTSASMVSASTAFFGAVLIFVLFWIRRAVRRRAATETAKEIASQFLWSCIFFSMISSTFGVFVSGLIWYSHDFIRTAGAVWFGLLTCVAIYPVRRDAKRLADSGPSPNRS